MSRTVLPHEYGGVAGPMSNGPRMRNRGIEVQVDYHDRFGKVDFAAGINGSYNKNKVVKFNDGKREIDGIYYTQEGYPYRSFYLMEVGKIVQDKSTEIDPLVLQGWTFSPSTPGNGDFLYKNTNGDKRIDADDRVVMGNPIPLANFGGYIRAAYAGIDLNVNFNGVLGWDRYLSSGVFSLNTQTERLYLKDHMNMWTEDNRNTTIPRIYRSNDKNDQNSDYHLYDASFLRIKTIQLGYTLPLKWTSKIHLKQVRVFVNLENFFTFTSYPGLDPEMGGDIGYPMLKTVSMGLNLKF